MFENLKAMSSKTRDAYLQKIADKNPEQADKMMDELGYTGNSKTRERPNNGVGKGEMPQPFSPTLNTPGYKKTLQKEAPETLTMPKRSDFSDTGSYQTASQKFKTHGTWATEPQNYPAGQNKAPKAPMSKVKMMSGIKRALK